MLDNTTRRDPVPVPSAGGRSAGLELNEAGAWLTVPLPEGWLEVNLGDEGLGPKSTMSFRVEVVGERQRMLRFPQLLDRLGEDAPVHFGDERNEKPAVVLRNLLAGTRRALQSVNVACDCLGIVVSGGATDAQRAAAVRTAEAAGWRVARVVNWPLAVAMSVLEHRRAGRYAVAVMTHGALEISLVDWEKDVPRVRAYAADPFVCPEFVDALMLARIFLALGGEQQAGETGAALGGRRAFFWLKGRAQQIRQRIVTYDSVRIDIPDGVLGDGDRSYQVERSDWERLLVEFPERAAALLDGALREAGWERGSLAGAILGGEHAHHPSLLRALRPAFAGIAFELAAPLAGAQGAARLAAIEAPPATEEDAARNLQDSLVPPPRNYVVKAEGARPAPPVEKVDQPPGVADAIIHRVRELGLQGHRTEAMSELQRLRQYVDALELSLKDPAEALGAAPQKQPSRDTAPSAASRAPESPADAKPSGNDERDQRRKYILAVEHIKDAQEALRKGRSDTAVSHSHAAYKESSDPRIFTAMIQVHLRAAARAPGTVQNFAEHREWLNCALRDDPTNREVHEALRKRYLLHIEQLGEFDTVVAKRDARKLLDELTRALGPDENTERLVQNLDRQLSGAAKA
jgi:hypothetical protein